MYLLSTIVSDSLPQSHLVFVSVFLIQSSFLPSRASCRFGLACPTSTVKQLCSCRMAIQQIGLFVLCAVLLCASALHILLSSVLRVCLFPNNRDRKFVPKLRLASV